MGGCECAKVLTAGAEACRSRAASRPDTGPRSNVVSLVSPCLPLNHHSGDELSMEFLEAGLKSNSPPDAFTAEHCCAGDAAGAAHDVLKLHAASSEAGLAASESCVVEVRPRRRT